VRTGHVSDMPYPAITSMPRSTASRASASGSAEPPMTTFQPKKSVVAASGWRSIICRMVGTQCENVTPSFAMRPSSVSGTYRPG